MTVSSPVSNSPLVINFGLNNTITSIANNCTIFVGSSSCQINVTTVFNNTTTGSALLTASASGYISGIGSINVAPVPTITLSTSSSLGSPYWSVSGSIGTFNGNLGQGVKLVATVNNLVETQTSINAGFTLTKNINSSYVSSGIQGDIVSFSNLNATNLTSCSISGTSSSCSVTMYNVNPYIPGVTLAVVGSVALNGGTLNLSILNNITQIIVQNVPLQFSYTNNNNTTPIVYYSITTDNSSIQYPTLDQYLANKSNGIAVVAPQVQSIGFNGITALAFTQPLYIVYNTSSGITSCNSTYTSLVNSSTSIGMNSTPSSLLGIWYIPGGGSFVSPPIPYNLNVLATVTIGNPGVSVSSGVTVNGGSYLNPGYVMSYSTLGTNNGNAIQFILRWGTSTTLCTIPPSHN